MPVTPARALAVLVLASTAVRLAWAAALEPWNDESYHYLYAVHPDWSYFDHPPMTMWLVRAGLTLAGGHVSGLSLRLGFVLLGAGSLWVLARWTRHLFGAWAGVYAAAALAVTGYFLTSAGAFALPDGPLTFFGLLTLWAVTVALDGPPRVRPWLAVGVAWGLAMLSKYTAAFLPAGVFVYLLVSPDRRRTLLTPGPYLAVAVGLLLQFPVLWWNVQNDWASFAFQTGRASRSTWASMPANLGLYLGQQVGHFLPWVWVALIAAVAATLRGWRTAPPAERLLVTLAVVPLAFFLVVSAKSGGMAHWPLVGFLPAYPLVGRRWAAWADAQPVTVRRRLGLAAAAPALAMVLFVAHVWQGPVFAKKDFTTDLSGWESVGRELAERGLLDRPGTFAFTSCWFDSGHLGYAVRNRLPVLCYSDRDARGFAFWSRPEEWVGRDGLLVDDDDMPWLPAYYAEYFERVELVAEFPMTRGGRAMRPVRVYLCSGQTRPYPFRCRG